MSKDTTVNLFLEDAGLKGKNASNDDLFQGKDDETLEAEQEVAEAALKDNQKEPGIMAKLGEQMQELGHESAKIGKDIAQDPANQVQIAVGAREIKQPKTVEIEANMEAANDSSFENQEIDTTRAANDPEFTPSGGEKDGREVA